MVVPSRFLFDRNTTKTVKGIALIMMFSLHFLAIPEWYIDYRFTGIAWFSSVFYIPLDNCVTIFAFLNGYFYSLRKSKNYHYSILKITDIWLNYLIVFLGLLVINLILGVYEFDLLGVMIEVLALKTPTMKFCWYVMFYVLSMLILPIYSKIAEKSYLLEIILGIFLPFLFVSLLFKFHLDNLYGIQWFSTVAMGYIIGHHNLYIKVFDKLFRIGLNKLLFVLVNIVLFIFSFMGTKIFYGFNFVIDFNLNFFYAPFLIYSLVNIISIIPDRLKFLLYPINWIGDVSLLMWFLHCAFFNQAEKYTQLLLYLPQNPILVLLWGLLLCFLSAKALSFPVNWIVKKKNEWLFS